MAFESEKTLLTRIVKLIFSIFFFSVCTVRDSLLSMFGRIPKGQCVILYYHGVAKENRWRFARQMDLLLQLTKPIAAGSQESCLQGKRYAAVTFDDALQSIFDNAVPELEARRIPATIFAVVDSLGEARIWKSELENICSQDPVVSAERLRSLSSDLLTVGSHSLTHPNLVGVGAEEARKEITDSRTRLRNILGRDVVLFSFPYGAFNQAIISDCREAGYERVFTTLPTLALGAPAEFVSGRVVVEPTDWELEFRLKVVGSYRWVPVAFAVKRGLKKLLSTLMKQPRSVGQGPNKIFNKKSITQARE